METTKSINFNFEKNEEDENIEEICKDLENGLAEIMSLEKLTELETTSDSKGEAIERQLKIATYFLDAIKYYFKNEQLLFLKKNTI